MELERRFASVSEDVFDERKRQDTRWGDSIERELHPHTWITVLTEEVGELAQAVLEKDDNQVYNEATQVAAVAMAMMEVLNFGNFQGKSKDGK